MLLRSRADTVLIGPHHARAEFVQNLEGGLITGQPELALELHGGHAGRLAGNKVCCPEPRRERRVAAFHDRADRQAGVLPAGPAAQYARAVLEAKRSADHTTMRADETRIPACLFQVCRARRVIREKLLKFRQSLRERQIGVLLDVHGGHGCLTYPVTAHHKPCRIGRKPDIAAIPPESTYCGYGCKPDRHGINHLNPKQGWPMQDWNQLRSMTVWGARCGGPMLSHL
jgi:hypothetical protein